MLNFSIRSQIRKLSLLNPNEEICGLIINRDNINHIFPCENISNEKQKHFILNPVDYVKASETGEIIALYHSQDSDIPSVTDNFNSFNHNIFSVIYCKNNDKFCIIEPKLKDYLDRKFNIKTANCYHLLKDYLKDIKNIELKEHPIEEGWFEKSPNLIWENFINEGGIEITDREIMENDILFFGESKDKIHHIGIYLGNDLFLHHPRNSRSCIEYLNTHYINRLVMIVRHKDLI